MPDHKELYVPRTWLSKKTFQYEQYAELLDYCMRHTNLGEKTEKILRNFKLVRGTITSGQYRLLIDIASGCALIPAHDPRAILRNIKTEEVNDVRDSDSVTAQVNNLESHNDSR